MQLGVNLNKTFKGTFWFAFSFLLQKAISILATPIFTRLFTIEEYGTYSMYSTWLSIITVIATFNISGPVYNTLSHKYQDRQDSLWSNSLYTVIAVSIISFIVFYLIEALGNGISGIDLTLLLLIFINILANSISSLWLAKSKYENNYLIPSIATICQALLSFGLAVGFCFLFSKNKVHGRIIGSIIPMCLMSIFALIFFIKKKDFKIDFGMIKNILFISFPLVFHYLAQDILGQGDRIFLEEYFGEEEVAIYSLSYSLAFLPLLIIQAINTTFGPWKFRKIESKDYMSSKRIIPYFACLVFSVTFLLSLISPEIILIFGGESYSEGAYLIPILCCSVFFVFFYDLYSTIEFYYEKTLVASIITFIVAGLNIGLNFWFVPLWGAKGAALTTLISYVVMGILHFISSKIILKKQSNQNDYFNDKFIILFVIISSIAIFLITFLFNKFIIRIIIFIIYIVILFAVIIIFRKKILSFIKNDRR